MAVTVAMRALAIGISCVNLQHRNNVRVEGAGSATLIFSHGFGCDQTMWGYLYRHFVTQFRVVMYDLVGSGRSDLTAYDAD